MKLKSPTPLTSNKNEVKLSDYVAEFLAHRGIERMFVMTGGAIANLLDSVFTRSIKYGDIKPICVMHEQVASMALDGYTRATGKMGAVAVTSGPGGTNLITGIACSYYDSIPGLYFTGQVRTWEYKGNSKQRQVGFQETDIVNLVKPIVKYSVMVTNPKDIRYELEKALWLAQSGRPGPVLIDLPMNVQRAQIDPKKLRSYKPIVKKQKLIQKKVNTIVEWLKKSKHPIIISGGGVRIAGAINELREFAKLCNIPVVATYTGVDTITHDNPLYAGILGTMGNRGANICIEKSDLVLAIGSRLAIHQVRSKPKEFALNAKIVHVDIDPCELKQRVHTDLALASDAKVFLTSLLDTLKKVNYPRFSDWAKEARGYFENNPICKPEYYQQKKFVHPYVFIKTLSEQMADNDILVGDAGQSLMFTFQATEIRAKQRLFTAGAHSPMGYSLPAAMGVAAHYHGGSPRVVCTIGDGSIQLNIQDLQTIYRYNLPVKIFVMNNHSYGAIMDYQEADLGGRYFATVPKYGYAPPDILAIAKAYKIQIAKITSQDNLAKKIKLVLNSKGPIVCDVDMGPRTLVTRDP